MWHVFFAAITKIMIMKKTFAMLCIIFVISQPAFSQNTTFGLKAGFNSASIDVDDGVDYDSRSGIHGGLLAHIHISRQFAVQPEVVFSMQGGESGNSKLKLNYVNVPVLLQYMNSGFRVQTGPQLGFLVAAESKTGNVEVDVDDYFNKIEFGWSIGAGYLFAQGIGIDARYNFGLTNIVEADNLPEQHNRVFQVGLFYHFNNMSRSRK
jgi:hypothetical protein